MATCFVIQGYGQKTDYASGRVLDLDASYEVIKTAVEAAGLECIRADEIVHSGIIDVPMYERLLNADLVIADLSTSNVNAAFELGVRHALKPYATIILAENNFKYPFDLNHIVIRQYEHLGEQGLSFREANRLINELRSAIAAFLEKPITDSPVYTFLPQLKPPMFSDKLLAESRDTEPVETAQVPKVDVAPASDAVISLAGDDTPSAKLLLDMAQDKIKSDDFSAARILLEEVRKFRKDDSFVLQQLALATYKSKQPTVIASLLTAKDILQVLNPETCNNPETLGIWGAIHKRLWELTADAQQLAISITAYERGFFLKHDYYNGINYAFLLNVRALETLKAVGSKDDAIADYVLAKRVRKEVLQSTSALIDTINDVNQKYWVMATLYEAAVGLEDAVAEADWKQKAEAMLVASWMQQTRIDQCTKLKGLIAAYKELVAKL